MTILRSNGKTEDIIKDEPVTILEISKIINGLVEPVFIGEFWVFTCKNGQRLKRDLNEKASNILNFDIYGDVVLAKDTELTPSFFIPPDVMKEIKSISDNLVNNLVTQNGDDDSGDLPKIDDEKVLNSIMNEAYKRIMGTPFDDLMKNFIIFDDGIKKVTINTNYNDRIDAVNKLLDFFIEQEDYNKCKQLQIFKDKLIKFYEEF